MSRPPTQNEIRALLADAGLRPDRRLGQHFLVDANLMRLLVAEADLGPRDTILEVGAGVGNLTELLVGQAGWVVAVELDARLTAVARERLAAAANLDLLRTDALKDKHTLVAGPVPERLVFTVQKEVADRLAAAPATRDYGPVGVLVQALADVEVLRRLAPSVFWPRPRVRSAMVRILPSAERRQRIADLATFRATIEGLFGHRRKQAARSLALSPTLGGTPGHWAERLRAVGLDPAARGETYSVQDIIRLANALADRQ